MATDCTSFAPENQSRTPFESFNGRLRDECLNENWFVDLQEARSKIGVWRRDYNEE